MTHALSDEARKHRDGCDIPRLADAAEWRLRNRLLLEIAARHAQVSIAFGFDRSRIDGVYPNLFRPEFFRQHTRDRVDRAFGSVINSRRRWREGMSPAN